MPSSKFKVGDLVQLKAGGPVMAVDDLTGSGKAWCSWFAGKKHERALFSLDTLQVPKEDEKK